VKEPSLSDASLPALLPMKNLTTLKIGEARFTLQALRQLKNLPSLKNLTLYETDLSDAEVETLKTELPDVKIDFQPLTESQRQKLEVYLK